MEHIFMTQARETVQDYYNERTDGRRLTMNEIYIVWFSKTLQNWKALVSTTLGDGMYYEVTYNGDTEEIYLDAYQKKENVVYGIN